MVNKTKKFFITFIITLTLQSTIAAMDQLVLLKQPQQWQNCFSFNLPSSFNIFTLLQQKIESRNKSQSRSTVKKSLLEKYKLLKTKDNNGESISDNDIYEIQMLWNELKSLYNYSWLDQQIYPLHKPINGEKLAKIRNKKPLCLVAHSDKYKEGNRQKIDGLFADLGNTQRPDKYMDFVVNPITEVAAHMGTQASFNILQTTCFLPSILFPQFFSNQETRFFKKEINQTNKEINQYNRSVKILERNIQTKHEELKKTLRIIPTKTKTSKF